MTLLWSLKTLIVLTMFDCFCMEYILTSTTVLPSIHIAVALRSEVVNLLVGGNLECVAALLLDHLQ